MQTSPLNIPQGFEICNTDEIVVADCDSSDEEIEIEDNAHTHQKEEFKEDGNMNYDQIHVTSNNVKKCPKIKKKGGFKGCPMVANPKPKGYHVQTTSYTDHKVNNGQDNVGQLDSLNQQIKNLHEHHVEKLMDNLNKGNPLPVGQINVVTTTKQTYQEGSFPSQQKQVCPQPKKVKQEVWPIATGPYQDGTEKDVQCIGNVLKADLLGSKGKVYFTSCIKRQNPCDTYINNDGRFQKEGGEKLFPRGSWVETSKNARWIDDTTFSAELKNNKNEWCNASTYCLIGQRFKNFNGTFYEIDKSMLKKLYKAPSNILTNLGIW